MYNSQPSERRDQYQTTTFVAGLTRYKETVSILKKGYEQERYRIAQILRSDLASKFVHEVTSVDIASYRDARLASKNTKTGKPLSPATVRLEMSLLSNFFDLARIEWGYTSGPNPCADVRKPKNPSGRDRRLTNREERQILRYAHGHANPQLYSIIVIALTTAMRQGEILGLQWEHINFKTRVAHLPDTKNGSKRDVPLSTKARDAITRLGVKSQGRIFSYTKHGLKSTWRVLVQRLAIEDLHFHDMRHEAISRLFELGTLDMMEIASISGHKSLAMLKRYTHLRANRLVHKLEGTKKKAQLAVLNHLIPYPGIVITKPSGRAVVFPDFGDDDTIMTRDTETDAQAVAIAQDLLLRTLLGIIREGGKLPMPDHYLDCRHHGRVVMIDPMAVA